MKTAFGILAAAVGLMVAMQASDACAAGKGNGAPKGKQNGTCATQQTATGSSAATRPADSQRRDGTFLSTGVTANGSTVRPGNGKGLQDGSRLSSTTPVTSTTAQ